MSPARDGGVPVPTVVVIGSNSFSGSDFVDLLLDEGRYHVVGISRSLEKSRVFLPYRDRPDLSRFEFHQVDLNHGMPTLLELLAARQPAYVVNFASQSEVAPSWAHPEQWLQTNAVSTAALGNYLKDQSWLRRYVHISTPEIYGSCEGVVSEDAPFNPSTPYAASRAAGELILRVLFKQYALPLTIIRSANVYGAHQQLHKIIPRAMIALKTGRMIDLHGGGGQQRSFIHIRDVSRAERSAMEHGKSGEAYHLATRDLVSVRELVQRICDQLGAPFEQRTRHTADRPGQDKAYILDSSKARRELQWEPRVTLDAGLREVHDWIERDWAAIESGPLEYVHKP